MRNIFIICLISLILLSCGDENPKPSAFLEYSQPHRQNMDGGVLAQLDHEINLGVYGDIHSLLIARNGQIVFEKYYAKYQRKDLHPLGASTQSIISAVVGTQMHDDETFSLSSKIIDYFPEYPQYFNNIPQKDQIEIRHLMTHTSGLWWNEWMRPFGAEDNDAFQMSISDNWIGNVLATPMIKEPGNNYNFNSGNAILFAPILQQITGKDVEVLTEEQLFSHLQITDWSWDRIPGDYVNAAWGLHLKPIDMLKIGYLYIMGGRWNDQVLFDEAWQIRSTSRHSIVSSNFSYGYFWWGFNDHAETVRYLRTNDLYFSWGDGGQLIFCVPHLNLVVVSTAGNYNNNETISFDMLKDYIFPSIYNHFQPN